ncbi:MAG: hypothetical protein AB3N63_07040 [Puniceicoccaceae bacterium]
MYLLKIIRQSLAVLMLTCCCAFASGLTTKSVHTSNSVESLREAILHLKETYGLAYPDGDEYLSRLEKISDCQSAEYLQLQKEVMLNHPHIHGYEWLVEVRDQYWGNHGPINTMFQNGDIHQQGSGGLKNFHSLGGRLEVISIAKNGNVERKRVLADVPEGIVRDADVSFDGKKVLFSMRHSKADDYHLYEIDVDGGNLRQLTFGSMISDVDPIYMPDGKILFSSTRDPKFCQCNRHISLNMFTMEPDGANILQVSGNDLADFHSSLMPDGRVLYSRWEYVDRHFGPSLGLWTSNPDGTRHALFMGNNAWSPGFMGDARVIPGTDKVVCIYGACHDLPWGAMAVVDRSKGLEGTAPIVHMWPEAGLEMVSPDDDAYNKSMEHKNAIDNFRKLETRYEDPYPVHDVANGDGGGHFFMVSKAIGKATPSNGGKAVGRMGIFLTDVFGNEILVYECKGEELGAFGAVPIAARNRPPAIPHVVDHSKDHGFLYVNDVYLGTDDEMASVEKGSIKYLRIIEAPPRTTFNEGPVWNVDAAQVTAMNWNLTNNKRILGDVPVEKDGSAFFKLPADTFVQIHALDEEKQMIQAMRSGTIVRPGETQGCIGCHENRLSAPAATNIAPLAMRRAPSELDPWLDTPSVEESEPFNYLTHVQPVFDQHCVSCHDYGEEAGDVLNLSGDLSYPFNVSYHELMSAAGVRYTGPEEKMVNFVGDGPPGVLPAYAWGSHRSKLVRILKEGHYDLELSDEDMQRITSWIDINAVYYGPYESYYPGRNPVLALDNGKQKWEAVLGELANAGKFKAHTLAKGHLVNFTRPELSPALDLIQDEEDKARALEHIHEAAALLAHHPREDQTNSEIARNEVDRHNADRLAALLEEEAETVEAVVEGTRHYQFK